MYSFLSYNLSISKTYHTTQHKYLENKNEIYLKGIAFKEDDHYKIDNDGLIKKENIFFEEVLKAIEHDLEQIKKIENKKESENYLKYWLLFK
jgi:hypothetical protein